MTNLNKNRVGVLYLISILLVVSSIILGLSIGSSNTNIIDIFKEIFAGNVNSPEVKIFLYIRLPRVIGSLICGSALALSGAIIQGVFSNKLASPSIIGINSGAFLAVTICSCVGILGGVGQSIFAFIGSFLTMLIIIVGLKKWGGSKSTIILIGVAINAFFGAISDIIITFFPSVGVMSNDFKVGDFSAVTYPKLIPALIIITITVIITLLLSKELEVLSLGEDNAKGLGMNTKIIRIIFLVLATILAGVSVSVCGLLSFVGLLVPHAVRKFTKGETKHLLPLTVIVGGGFVTLCDTISRVIFAPYEIPVGIIMAFIGAPLFIIILLKGRTYEYD